VDKDLKKKKERNLEHSSAAPSSALMGERLAGLIVGCEEAQFQSGNRKIEA